MTFNQNSGYGAALLAAMSVHSKGGQIFVVAKSDAAARQIMQDIFPVDPTGVNRFAATIDAAIGYTTANKGDAILVAPGHTETLSAASAIALDVAGVSIIGLGQGADIPTLTFSDTAATFAISAASCSLKNIKLVPSVDSVVSPLVLTGDDVDVDILVQDASDAIEFVRGVLATGVNRGKIKMNYIGRPGGNACVNAIQLNGCSDLEVEMRAYGKASTAWVEFITAASTNIKVNGWFYNSGTTNFTKTVVDTITGSIWSAEGFDAAASSPFSGGAAAVLAGDDVSAVSTAITALQADVGDPSARTNFQSLETMLGMPDAANSNLDDMIRTGFDSTAITVNPDGSVMERLETIQAQQGGTAGIATFPAGAQAADTVSMAEVLRYAQESLRLGTGGTALANNKSIYDALGSDGNAVTDVATSVLGAIGANNNNNAFDSTNVVANADGSVLERLEQVQGVQNQYFQGWEMRHGLMYKGTNAGTAGPSATTFDIPLLNTFGDDYFNNKFYAVCVLNALAPGVAPEREIRQITDFVNSGGVFTVTAFSSNLSAGDEIVIVHESLLATGYDSADNSYATTNVAANEDGNALQRLEQLQEAINRGTGTALAANKSVVDALGTDGLTVLDTAYSVLGAIGADNNNNAFASTSVVPNEDGSVLERAEQIKNHTGLVYQGTCDAGMIASQTSIVSADLAGYGDDFFNTKYYLQVIKNAGTPSAAPELEVQQIDDYVSATGTFTTAAFTANVEASDEILVLHESQVLIGRDSANNIASTSNVVGNKDGSIVERLEDISQELSGTVGIASFPAAAEAANDVSLAEVIRYISDKQAPKVESKAYADLTGFDTAAAFTVTGDVMVRVVGVVGVTGITCTSGTTTLSVGTTEDPDAILPATTIDNSDFAATDVWVDNNPEDDAGPISTTGWVVIGGGADIILTRSVDDITAGTLTLYCEWKPLSADGDVTPA